MSPISSEQNPRVKLVRLLQRQAKTRRSERRLVLEGVRLIADALDAGIQPDFVFFAEEALSAPAQELITRLENDGVSCLAVTDPLLAGMANTETPQGVLAVVPWPELPIPAAPDLIVVADGWRDPGNLGTLLRTAAAAGVPLVLLTPGTVDPFNPKTLRAGMGAHFRVPVLAPGWPEVMIRLGGRAVYLADAAATVPYDGVDWTHPSALVIGGEAHGVGPQTAALPHTRLLIPMAPGAESLNAAIAASLLIYAARRHTLPPLP